MWEFTSVLASLAQTTCSHKLQRGLIAVLKRLCVDGNPSPGPPGVVDEFPLTPVRRMFTLSVPMRADATDCQTTTCKAVNEYPAEACVICMMSNAG